MSDPESALIQELRAIALADPKADDFVVQRDNVVVSVGYTSGSSARVQLSARYDAVALGGAAGGYRADQVIRAIRPMTIELRPERDEHREGKAAGIDVELQTGDAAFDDLVYVDTRTPADVLRHVLNEAARRAVIDLFALEFTAINLDDSEGRVHAEIVTFASLAEASQPGLRAIDAFTRLARAMPRVIAIEGAHAAHPLQTLTRLLGVLGSVSIFGGAMFYFGVTMGDRCPSEGMTSAQVATCFTPGIIGVVVGLVVSILAGMVASRFTMRFSGRSDSSRSGSNFAWAVGILAFGLTASFVAFLAAHAS